MIGRGQQWGSTSLGVSPRGLLSSRFSGAWYGGAQDLEGSGIGEPWVSPPLGVSLSQVVEPNIEGSLVQWSPGLGGVWYG